MRQRGFTIIEILSTLLILSLVATIAGRIFTQSMRGIGDQRLRQWHDATEQSLIDHLRADVWTSTGVRVSDGELHLGAGERSVSYRVEEQQLRRIRAGEEDMRWEQHGKTRFAVSAGLVTFTTPARTLTFVAPVIGQGGGQ